MLIKNFSDFKINHLDCPASSVETLTYGSYTPVKAQYLSGEKITYSCNSQFTLESSTMLTRECTSGQFEPRFSTANLLCNPGIFSLIIKKFNKLFTIKSRHILFFWEINNKTRIQVFPYVHIINNRLRCSNYPLRTKHSGYKPHCKRRDGGVFLRLGKVARCRWSFNQNVPGRWQPSPSKLWLH